MSKYGNRKTEVDGIVFDSKREAARWQDLLLLLRAGEISELQRQVRYELIPAYTNGRGKKIRKMEYVADFVYLDKRELEVIVEDAKGYRTKDYQLKKKIFEHVHHPLTITEV